MSEKQFKKSKKNKVRRYRLNDYTANKLGCPINRSKRYRLTDLQEIQLISFSQVPIRRLFWDIETSPNVVYAWRIGYNINLNMHDIIKERAIICISYKWEGDDKVYSLKWDENQDDKAMLEEFIKVINTADESIGHNSDRFDSKWIKTRCIFHRIRTFPKYKSLDTLKKAKYGFNFNSNKLDYIAQYLGVGAKVKHEGFDMWKKILEDNDEEAMANMIRYCEGDVIVLEDVFHAMQPYMDLNTHVGSVNGRCNYSCPSCGSEAINLNKNIVTAKGAIQRQMECEACGHYYTISQSSYKLFRETTWNSNL